MPDAKVQELQGREADLHKALHELLQQHHKVPQNLNLCLGAETSILVPFMPWLLSCTELQC